MALEKDVARLAGTRPFALLPRAALQLLAFACEKLQLPADATLFQEGDLADGGYFVLSGSLALRRQSDAQNRAHAVGADHLIGESALFAQVLRPCSATALEDSTLLRIPRKTVARVLGEFPEAAAGLRDDLAERAGRLTRDLDAVRLRLLDFEATTPGPAAAERA